jgi:hypothetical protein
LLSAFHAAFRLCNLIAQSPLPAEGLLQAEGGERAEGKRTEAWEIIYFTLSKSQIPVIAQAIETAALMLRTGKYYVDLDAALEAHKRQTTFNVVDLVTGWKIDFIFRKSRAFSEEEFRRRARFNLQGVPLFVASAEDVVISKLEWAKLAQSVRQIEDVAAILRMRWDLLDQSYLEKWIRGLGLATEWNDARNAAAVSE